MVLSFFVKMNPNLCFFSFVKHYKNIFKAKFSTSKYYFSNELNVKSDEDARFNEIGLQMLPVDLYKQIFGDVCSHECQNIKEVHLLRKELSKFGISTTDNKSIIPSVDINIPDLKNQNIEEHFNIIASEQIDPYYTLIKNFKDIPPVPKFFSLKEGWVRYTDSGYEVVEYPQEQELILDVEICMKSGPLPVLAAAVSKKFWYTWASKHLVQGSCPSFMNRTMTPGLLIPLESSETDNGVNLSPFQLMPKIVIGHNVSFDRLRIKEQYWVNETATKFLDTMSLHVCISGTSSYQRSLLRSKNSNKLLKNELQNLCSLNNLADVYKLYCGKELDKTARNTFVHEDLIQIKKDFHKVMTYCAADVMATHDVLKKVFPLFTSRFPHAASLAGMLELNSVYLPVNYNWTRYLEESETIYNDLDVESKICLSRRADRICRLLMDNQYKKDPWMWDQDWTIKELKLKKYQKKVKSLKKCIEPTRTLDDKFEYLNASKSYLPKRIPKISGYPNWYRKLFHVQSKTINLMPMYLYVTTSMLITPKLLSLRWEQFPLHHVREYGWGFLVPNKTHNLSDLIAKSTRNPHDVKLNMDETTFNNNNNLIRAPNSNLKQQYLGNSIFFKLPHKDGLLSRVGNPLAKDFIYIYSKKILDGTDADSTRILEIARMSSYWKNNRDRILSQIVIWLDNGLTINLKQNKKIANVGVLIPQVIVAGTLTRRAVESTWMTAANAQFDRIGSELRAMINAPANYNIVGADVDSQELWIASIIGDSFLSNYKIHGATPFSWMTLIGNKSMGTDMHSVTAKAIGITRDQAKIINYARIYGAGPKFAERLLKQFNPTMSNEDALKKSKKMFLMTKGKKLYQLKTHCMVINQRDRGWTASEASLIANSQKKSIHDLFEKRKWFGGTESVMFNSLEDIAQQESPKTPFLNARLSRALEKEVDEKHLPTKINWVVQSAAVDFLHLILVCMRWLMKDKVRLCLSFHDEVRYLVPSKFKYNAALAMHVTNLLVRCFFVSRLGMKDLPMSVAFFTSVEVDIALRKEANQDYITPSNPHGLKEGYGIRSGESLTIWDAVHKSNGCVGIFLSNKK